MKMLLTAIAVLVLCTSRLVVADSFVTVCNRYYTYYTYGASCQDILDRHPIFNVTAGYYFITPELDYFFCGMYQFTGASCENIYNDYKTETTLKNGYAKQKHLGCKKGEANQKQQLSDYKSIYT